MRHVLLLVKQSQAKVMGAADDPLANCGLYSKKNLRAFMDLCSKIVVGSVGETSVWVMDSITTSINVTL